MLDTISQGGSIVWLILACSIFALGTFLEKCVVIYRSRLDTEKFLNRIEELVKDEKIQEAEVLCGQHDTPVSRVVRAGISNLNSTHERVQNRMEEVALVELPRLESRLGIMTTVANVTPLLGLFGTVTGMMKAFHVIQEKAQTAAMVNPGDLAEGIGLALVTTACGLGVAIPTLVGYNYLRHYFKIIRQDMERAASRILALA